MSEHTHDHDCGCGGEGKHGGHHHHGHHGHGHGRGKHGGGFGPHRFHHGAGFGGPWGAGPGGRGHGHGPMRAKRGAVGFGILMLLTEGPKHGYQLIQELGEKSGGMWQPSAGSVYPALEKLEAKGLVTSADEGDKKVYSLTDAGRAKAEHFKEMAPPWATGEGLPSGVKELREAMMELGSAAMQVARSGSDDQRARAVEVITKARKSLYTILAED